MGFISRQIEKIYKSVLFRRHDPDGSIYYFSHKDFPALSAEEISFTSQRGHILRGCFYSYPEHRTDRLILLEHGMGNGHNAYFREIELLCRAGYRVFSYDHTGCNRSEGEHIFGLSGSLSDLDDCINALVKMGYPESVISVVGHSWGGFSTLNILAYHPDLHSIVAMSGFISVTAMHSQLVPFPFGIGLFALEQNTNPSYASIDAITVLRHTDRPALIIHSTDDKTVSYKKNLRPLAAALDKKPNASFLTVSGSGHNPTYTAEAFAYKESFFKDLKRQRKKGRLETEEQRAEFLAKYDFNKMTEQNPAVWDTILTFLNE